jgi:hypothetical protein
MFEGESLLWRCVFEFPENKTKKGEFEAESLVWSKYAENEVAVHHRGVALETQKRERRPEVKYSGYISAVAANIRQIRIPAGHGFYVVHDVSDGQAKDHVSVGYLKADGVQFTKSYRSDLKASLQKVFSELTPPESTG